MIEFTEPEDGMIFSKSPVYIDCLDEKLEVWICSEDENQRGFSPKQQRVFENFLKLKTVKDEITQALKNYYTEMLFEGRILPSDNFSFKKIQILLPNQDNSNNDYLILLPETHWQINNSEWWLELEILFTNNQLEVLQEMTGMWARLEWAYNYNCFVK